VTASSSHNLFEDGLECGAGNTVAAGSLRSKFGCYSVLCTRFAGTQPRAGMDQPISIRFRRILRLAKTESFEGGKRISTMAPLSRLGACMLKPASHLSHRVDTEVTALNRCEIDQIIKERSFTPAPTAIVPTRSSSSAQIGVAGAYCFKTLEHHPSLKTSMCGFCWHLKLI